MNQAFNIFQIIIGTVVITSVILQSRGTDTGMVFGGSGESYRSKRGLEKFLFYVTIIGAVLFVTVSLLSLFFR